MKILAAVLASLLLFMGTDVFAQDWAKTKMAKSPRHMEWVTVQAGKRKVRCFVAYPEVKTKATVVVLIHEIFGLSDWVRSVADDLAANGFIAVAPDLLSEMGPQKGGTDSFSQDGKTDEDAVRKAVSDLPPAQVTSDLNAVTLFARAIPAGNGKVAVAGFCWGGGQAFRFATNNKDVKASFVFYGPAPEPAELKKLNVPVYGFYAENDARINTTLESTKTAAKKFGKKFEPVIYPGSGHGFLRAGEAPDASKANAEARKSAWERFIALLRKL